MRPRGQQLQEPPMPPVATASENAEMSGPSRRILPPVLPQGESPTHPNMDSIPQEYADAIINAQSSSGIIKNGDSSRTSFA